MPWNGTTLYLSNVGVDGTLANTRVIAGGAAESVFQPEWPPDGNEIIFVSDRTGWWNLYANSRSVRGGMREGGIVGRYRSSEMDVQQPSYMQG